jgi:hypothetical protein
LIKSGKLARSAPALSNAIMTVVFGRAASPNAHHRFTGFAATAYMGATYGESSLLTANTEATGWHINCGYSISDGGTGQTA